MPAQDQQGHRRLPPAQREPVFGPDGVDQAPGISLSWLGKRRVPTTAIVVGTLASDWLVEIEVIAAG